MNKAITTFKIIHRIYLFAVLLLVAIIPFCYSMKATTAYVYAPLLIVLLSVLSLIIENRLARPQQRIRNERTVNEKQPTKLCLSFKKICC